MIDDLRNGRRVVVRKRAEIIDGRQRFRDVVGELLSTTNTQVLVRRDNGDTVAVERHDIVAAKEIPPKPTSFKAIAGLERAAARTWPAIESEWLGGWLLRASHGWTNRANTALPLGDPRMDLDDAITHVVGWYRERGLEPGFAVPLPLSRRVARRLGELGWRTTHTVSVQTAPTRQVVEAGDDTDDIVIESAPTRDWLATATASRDGDPPPHALDVLGSGDDRAYASIRRDGRPVACGRGAVSGSVVVLSLFEVLPGHRRHRLATTVMSALAAWGAERGATTVCVQVVEDNADAFELYRVRGFVTHHSYVNLRPPT